MAPPPPLGTTPPAPKRLARDLGSTAVTSTHASAELPAKSLCQYQCVSKEWRAVISNPALVAVRRSRPEPLLVAMCCSKSGKNLQLMDTEGTVVKVVMMEDLAGVQNWTLQVSLGNLVCITGGYDHSGTLVVDLATGKTLLACLEPAEDVAACVPKHYTCFGFGRARQSGSLKVFRVAIPQPGDTTETCEVLTLGDGANKWRHTKSPPTTLSLWNGTSSGVAVNGALHFLTEDKNNYVLSFDLDNEEWKMIHGPKGVKKAINIAELNGALCMLHRVQNVTNIWLLGDSDENIWSKAYKIRKAPFSEFKVPLRVLRIGGELVFYYYDNTGNRVLQVYDPRSRKCTKVKTPTNLVGRIGLCNSNLDPRFCC